MSDALPDPATSPSGAQPSAGAMLRAAREAHGWSIDAVSQQLKLAPRQVRALEDDRPEDLPGRTFVRGFARNYARLVNLDPDAVIAAIPDPGDSGATEAAPLSASSRSIGEMPATSTPRAGSFARWAIPLLLVALIAAAAFYEFARPGAWSLTGEPREPVQTPRRPADAAMVPPAGTPTPLPNPLVSGDLKGAGGSSPIEGAAAPAGAPSGPTTPAGTVLSPSSQTGSSSLLNASGPVGAQSSGGTITTSANPVPSATVSPTSVPSAAPQAADEPTLVITYRQSAWTEVRDGKGARLLLHTGAAGTQQAVQGVPPLDLTLGNASEVSVTWRGAALDLAPHVRQNNIARVRLQ